MDRKNLVGCFVVDNNGFVIIQNGDLIEFLCKKYEGIESHVMVGYWEDISETTKKIRVFPIEQVYFWIRPRRQNA